MMNKVTFRMLDLAKLDPKDLSSLMLKLVEEVGELAEAVNHRQGNLPHKIMKEPLEGEVADVINCAISVFVRANPTVSADELFVRLVRHLDIKADKWEKVIEVLRRQPG